MKLTNTFAVPLGPDEAWRMLLDVERIVHCVPGAEIVETVDDKTFKGKVSVRLGPVTLAFTGKAWFTELDEANHCATLQASGTDLSGRGGARAKTMFRLRHHGDGTEVVVETDLQLSGAVAQYGRASGVIADVATQLIDEFAECLRAQLAVSTSGADLDRLPAGAASPPPASDPVPAKPIGGFTFAVRVLVRRVRRWLARIIHRE